MMQFYDRIQETCNAPGVGPFAMLGATAGGYFPWSDIGDSSRAYYAAHDAAGNVEIGEGTYQAAGNLLSRDTVLRSTNANAKVAFTGVVTVWFDLAAAFLNSIPNSALQRIGLAVGGTAADLSATGGPGQYLRQSAAGAVITVGMIPLGDLPPALPVDAGTLTGATLAPNVVNSSLKTVGALTAGSIPYSLLTGVPEPSPVNAGTLLGATLAPNVIHSSLTDVATLTAGMWQAAKIDLAYGGTGRDLSATGGPGQYLKQVAAGAPISVGQIPPGDLPARLDAISYTHGAAEFDNGNSGAGTVTINWLNGDRQKLTLTGNCTMAHSNITGRVGGLQLRIIQGAGAFTITWPTAASTPKQLTAGGAALPAISSAAGAVDIFGFFSDGVQVYAIRTGAAWA